jgi:hypothetical protein
MKNIILFSVFSMLAYAVPRHLFKERTAQITRDIPNYPGIQFGSNGKLSITVFSDLHFGERELSFRIARELD